MEAGSHRAPAARGDGQRATLLRLGPASVPGLPGGAVGFARPWKLASAGGRPAAAVRAAGDGCRRIARPSRLHGGPYRRQFGRRLSRPAAGDDPARAGPEPRPVRLDAWAQEQPGADLDPADPGEGTA